MLNMFFFPGSPPWGRRSERHGHAPLEGQPSRVALGRPASAGCSPHPPLHAAAGLAVMAGAEASRMERSQLSPHSPPPTPGGHTARI